jgi:NADPH:quinone reductase-like Zn-dependent oxidoreductase
MKAWALRNFGKEKLELMTIPDPKPGPKEVLVRVSAVSLNYRDKLLADGLYNANLHFPITQVADACGEVVETGPGVTRFRAGERVITHYATRWIDGEGSADASLHTLGNTIPGALADYFVLSEEALVRAPDHLSDDEAACLPCAGITAWYALVEKGRLRQGQTVLIQGTGGVSIFGVQIASALGARVVATSSSDEKLARVQKLGAHEGVNYARNPEWEHAVLALTDGKGADHVLEVAGGRSLGRSIAASASNGQIAIIGILDGFTSEIPVFPIIKKQLVIRGITTGPRRALEDMTGAFERMRMHPVIDTVFSFGDAPKAYDHLYRGAFGKIVIRVKD